MSSRLVPLVSPWDKDFIVQLGGEVNQITITIEHLMHTSLFSVSVDRMDVKGDAIAVDWAMTFFTNTLI